VNIGGAVENIKKQPEEKEDDEVKKVKSYQKNNMRWDLLYYFPPHASQFFRLSKELDH
jgi:hypothetical protein